MTSRALTDIATPAADETGGAPAVARGAIGRSELFTGLFALGFANGFTLSISEALQKAPLSSTLLNTFGISAVVWLACIVGLVYSGRESSRPATRFDFAVAAVAILAFLPPVPYLSWLTIGAIALYVIHTSAAGSFARRGAAILLAVTVPMFWSRATFSMLSDTLLHFDATLVANLVGTTHSGNAIAFPDGSGYLWIAPACSSVGNVSLALLCYVVFAKTLPKPLPPRTFAFCILACAAVIAINVLRLSLLAVFPHYFDLIHGPIGQTVANWLTLAAMVAIIWYGVRRRAALAVG